jgi:hypothetical protein
MTIRCPVCRADNDTGPFCRRCKADLAPLFELEERRALALEQAVRAAADGLGEAVLRHARAAQLLRSGPDALRWLAAGHLLRRDFARAVGHWQLAARICAKPQGESASP